MEPSCLISLSLMLLVAMALQKNLTGACSTHPNCCSGVPFRKSTASPPLFTHVHASSARARRFAFVVCGSAPWKLGHTQPEWLHHRRNPLKHLSLLFVLVLRKDPSAASYRSFSAPRWPTFDHPSHVFVRWLYPECTLEEIIYLYSLMFFISFYIQLMQIFLSLMLHCS